MGDSTVFSDTLFALLLPLIVALCLFMPILLASPATGRANQPRRSRRRSLVRRSERTVITARVGSISRYTTHLPLELVEEIIDYLQDEKRTLQACMLTHRDWQARTRRHLHRKFVVKKGGHDPYRLRFYPQVARCIRQVTVQGDLFGELLNSTLSDLALVDSLYIDCPRAQRPLLLSHAQIPHFPRITNLHLRGVYFRTWQDMAATLSSLPCLSRLRIDLRESGYAIEGTVSPYVWREMRLPLEKLRIDLDPALIYPMQDAPRAIATSGGASMKQLSVNVSCLINRDEMHSGPYIAFSTLQQLDLSANTTLDSVSLSFSWYWLPWRQFALPANGVAISTFLSHFHSPCLRVLTFCIHIATFDQDDHWLRYIDLGFFDLFAEPPMSPLMTADSMERVATTAQNIKQFCLKLKFDFQINDKRYIEIEQQVKSQLPALTARGILHVTRG